MATKLIAHLRTKSNEHEQLKLLVNQWEFDEKLIPKALQNISQLFPHYSRHDVSHSLQILVNIERLLGENIHMLTATDTWLILEAAYWHDIGMVVAADTISNDLSSKEFQNFLTKIAGTLGHELRDFARKFNPYDAASCFADITSPLDAVEKFRLLVAEYYRQQHPERAEAIVLDPWKEANISSPRNELLPTRLFLLLGRICHLHGKDFNCIPNELQLRQVGLGGEDCHPRFIACLLRLGDLLDLEDNRFCPVMLRMVNHLPLSSQAHIDKHKSIRHFRLDKERIEIIAYCNNATAYEETERWFSWLEQEMQKQMAVWGDIVPKRDFGLLPTLGELQVHLEGDEQWLDFSSKEHPRFDIDPEKAIELLQGAGLYNNSEQSLRELLQNAVDATLQRVWLECSPDAENSPLHNKLAPKDWNNPYDENMAELLKQYSIEVKLEPIEHREQVDEKKLWQLNIRDHGIGITKEDLKQMRHVGASSKNLEKNTLIQKMPQWMRPSGAFGIGLQSAFMLTDKIDFQTKSYLTKETYNITLHSPLSPEQGLIVIKKLNSSISIPYGSGLTLIHEFKKIPGKLSRIKLSSFGEESTAYKILCGFDPIKHQELEYEQAKWIDEIVQFAKNSPVPINIYFNNSNINIKIPDKKKIFFDPETNIGIEIFLRSSQKIDLENSENVVLINTEEEFSRSKLFFRGQLVADYIDHYFYVNSLKIIYHLWGINASELLSINRNSIKAEKMELLQMQQEEAFNNYLKQVKLSNLEKELVKHLSAYIQILGLENLHHDLNGQWKELSIFENNLAKSITFNKLAEIPSFNIYYFNYYFGPGTFSSVDKTKERKNNDFAFEVTSIPFELVIIQLQLLDFHVHISEIDRDYIKFVFDKKGYKNYPLSDQALKKALMLHIKSSSSLVRITLPVYKDFGKLKLKPNTKLPYIGYLQQTEFLFGPIIIMPFCFYLGSYENKRITIDALDILCKWTVKNAEDSSLTEKDARVLYENLIDWIDNTIMSNEPTWKELRENKSDSKINCPDEMSCI